MRRRRTACGMLRLVCTALVCAGLFGTIAYRSLVSCGVIVLDENLTSLPGQIDRLPGEAVMVLDKNRAFEYSAVQSSATEYITPELENSAGGLEDEWEVFSTTSKHEYINTPNSYDRHKHPAKDGERGNWYQGGEYGDWSDVKPLE